MLSLKLYIEKGMITWSLQPDSPGGIGHQRKHTCLGSSLDFQVDNHELQVAPLSIVNPSVIFFVANFHHFVNCFRACLATWFKGSLNSLFFWKDLGEFFAIFLKNSHIQIDVVVGRHYIVGFLKFSPFLFVLQPHLAKSSYGLLSLWL